MSEIIEHIVLFKVNENADSVKIDDMVNDLNKLAAIEQVLYISAAPIRRLKSSSASAFTHVLHSRYRSKEDLRAYIAHPLHLSVVERTMPIWDEIVSVDWIADQVPKPPAGSVAKVTLMKVKENVDDEAKKEIVEAVKEKSDEISVGENFSPVRAKGFSIASVAYFKDLGDAEAHEEFVKDKVGGYLDDTIVVDFVTL